MTQYRALESHFRISKESPMHIARIVVVALGLAAHVATACTVVVAGRNATKDGSVYVAHTEDAGLGAMDLRLVRVPAMDHADGATRSVYTYKRSGYPRIVSNERGDWYKPVDGQALSTPLGHIPQVPHTYAYLDQDYAMINEKQLALAESSCGAKTVGFPLGTPGGKSLFSINELTKVALERCDNARCAVKTMGDLAVEYGFYNDFNGNVTHPEFASSGEALAIGDKNGEAWIFHVLTGPNNGSAVWAAQRVPEDHISAIANGFVIRQMNLSDSTTFLASSNVHTFAREMGWWDPEVDGSFDFTAAYGFSKDGPLMPLYVGRRLWRIFDVFAPSKGLRADLGFFPEFETYPFSVAPDAPVSVKDVFTILRDHYEGTPFDLTEGLEAGPWGNPNRNGGTTYGFEGGWERAISLARTVSSFVAQSNPALPDAVGGVTWFGLGSPHGAVYVPFSCAQESVPASYTNARMSHFSTDAAWWAFNMVNNWLELRYSVMYPEVFAKLDSLQDAAIAHYETSKSTWTNATTVETSFNAFASRVVDEWWTLSWHIVSKYHGGSVLKDEDEGGQVSIPYPKWWIQLTRFSLWPGNSLHLPMQMRATKNVDDKYALGLTSMYVLVGISAMGLAGIGVVLFGQKRRPKTYMRIA
ncbi:Aste57867_7746 [Aphanomyces stellatus]|uniref:Aste57867_7746 protein n=1 Tax=Aphanomyces stellatus TaxID=120398 RepID=A0A485KIR2_9STRA|nr:hypothetical protein As57867_007717 [Aphanomyces stellatus]VFT84646.1 Aste57867_7746 [Aphanomyces stellatus]